MNGEMMLYGYRFKKKIQLNFSNRMVFLSAGEYSLVYNIFEFLERFFNRKHFSDVFLDKGLGVYLNGSPMKDSEFTVYRLPALIQGGEELKVLKKNLLGRFVQHLFTEKAEDLQQVVSSLDEYILKTINAELSPYHLRYRCGDDGILDFWKMFVLDAMDENNEVIEVNDLNQFSLKEMLVDFVEKLPVRQAKLLLVEYPEYGLDPQQTEAIFRKLIDGNFEYVMIHTQAESIKKYCQNIYSYHVVNEDGMYGFDEYDDLERKIQEQYSIYDEKQIEQQIISELFSEGKFKNFLKEYRKQNLTCFK